MRLPKRGERGFTLIELLIVVAILGVLAAVVIPNVTQFFGKGEDEARRTEFHNISLAVATMMIDNEISSIPTPGYIAGTNATNQMGYDATYGFPDFGSVVESPQKEYDPDGDLYTVASVDQNGYVLFGHDINGGDGAIDLVNYLNMSQTVYFYTCASDGTVRQWDDALCTTEYTQ